MQQMIKKIIYGSLIMLFVLVPLFDSNAQSVDTKMSTDQYDSLHRYNALENKASLAVLLSQEDIRGEYSAEIIQNNVLDREENKDKFVTLTEMANNEVGILESTMNKIKNRNSLQMFILGDAIGTLKFQLVQLKDKIELLRELSSETPDGNLQSAIDENVETFKKEQAIVENFINKENDRFSLLGWFVRMI